MEDTASLIWMLVLACGYGVVGLGIGCIMRRDLSRHIVKVHDGGYSGHCDVCGEYSPFSCGRWFLMYSSIFTWPVYVTGCIVMYVALLIAFPFMGIHHLYEQINRSIMEDGEQKRTQYKA